ncbi:YdcH family protein [Helicobacter cappadocius]|uniref:YdcH family protein n=1 Tax=Helicobacter cappadocius TaxID=3063998 RepID=A0AA90PHD8_9HELI|nr:MULTISPECIES: YdcH family protein [unclassified Helicobacter]MDO7252455.1 YdcH family protein [Helicobacter sp. faydin-H75]MDP2538322.1 YdcH family protein [Helicobacter sp. faydin-H76]
MFHEYRDEISALKAKNAHFEKIFEEHNELDKKVTNAENGLNPLSDIELDKLKKQKLKLKDEVYAMIMEYRKNSH